MVLVPMYSGGMKLRLTFMGSVAVHSAHMMVWPKSFFGAYDKAFTQGIRIYFSRMEVCNQTQLTGTVRYPAMTIGSVVPTMAGYPCEKYQLHGCSP